MLKCQVCRAATVRAVVCTIVGSLVMTAGLVGLLHNVTASTKANAEEQVLAMPAVSSSSSNASVTIGTSGFQRVAQPLPDVKRVTIPFRHDDRALMVSAKVDGTKQTTLILDTGATYTSISRQMAQELGYDLQHTPTVKITTANGQISIPKITLKELTLNGYTVKNVEATVMPLPDNVPFSGLLGLNFIKRQKLTIDPTGQQLVLEPLS